MTLAIKGVSGKAIVSRDSAYYFFFPTSQPFVIQLKEREEEKDKAYRSRNISTGDSLRRSVKVVESGRLADLGNDFGTDTECYAKKKTRDMLAKGKEKEKKSTCKRLTRETTLNSDQMLGLLHTLNDSLDIQRPDTPKVDDLNLDTLFLLQQLGSLERVGDHLAVGDDGNVGTSLFNLGLADGDEEVLGEFFLGHGEMDTVEELVLKETNLQTEISFREI